MSILLKISAFVSKYMALLVLIVTAIALFIPWTFRWATPHVTILLSAAMFGMGMTLKPDDFRLVLKRPRDVLIGVLAQFTIMPMLAWLIAKAFDLPAELAVGVILVGTCPGGTSSNVMTYLARGDVALSVSMTIASTLLAPFVTPLLTLWLAGEWLSVSFSAMMMSIVQVVILPIALGVAINSLFGAFVRRIEKLLPLISITAILLILGGVVSVSTEKIMSTGLIIFAAVACHNLFGYGVGFILAKLCRMEMSKAKAIAIEVGMQNSGLATSLAMTHFNPTTAIPGAIFSVWHNISGAVAANYFASLNRREN